jgi:hypothetical protein
MSATEYIAHFGIPGQKKGIRNFQSYETAPTRSGMVGEERGLAAKQAARLAKQEEKDNKYKDRLIKESDKYYSRAETGYEARSSKFRKKASKTENEKRIAKFTNKAEAAEKKLRNVEKLHKYANESIRNMTHEEIKKEKVQRGIDTLGDIGGIMMGVGMRMMGAPVSVYLFGTGDLRKQIRRDNNAQKYYQQKYGKKMEFEHSNLSADDYIAHFGVPGQQWFKRHFQSYKTAPTRSGKVGEEIGLAAKQAERLGEDEKPSDKPKNLDSYGLKGYERQTDKYFDGYSKSYTDDDGMPIYKKIESQNDGSIDEKSIKLMKYTDDNWKDVKKTVMDIYTKELIDDFEKYADMTHTEAEKVVKNALNNSKNTELYIRPIGDWGTLDISLYNPGDLSWWSNHFLSIEYDPYNKKTIGGMSMDG